jgi:hypothetical protein
VWILWRRVLLGRKGKGNDGDAGRSLMPSGLSVLSGYGMSPTRNLSCRKLRIEQVLRTRRGDLT